MTQIATTERPSPPSGTTLLNFNGTQLPTRGCGSCTGSSSDAKWRSTNSAPEELNGTASFPTNPTTTPFQE